MSDIIETYDRNGVTVNIYRDEDGEYCNPEDWGNYEIIYHKDIETDDDGDITKELSAKLKDGTAFWIDKYDHSQVVYSLNHEGMSDRWDTSFKYGLIVFTDEYATNADTYEGRQEMARQDLKTYTEWANGEVYGWDVEDADGNNVEACGGYIGWDSIEDIKIEANAIADDYRIPRKSNPAQRLHS